MTQCSPYAVLYYANGTNMTTEIKRKKKVIYAKKYLSYIQKLNFIPESRQSQ